jgi:hypothetical protein
MQQSSACLQHLGAAALVFIGLARSPAQNPNGFIQSDQWACLLPLVGNDCTGGGEHTMALNWVAPRSLATQNPLVGTVWADIDFGRTAKSPDYRGVGLPTFVNLNDPAPADAVDLGAYLARNGLTDDSVMAVAVTYVENTLSTALPVGVCTASDDSVQVWINSTLVVNRSICRALDADCAEITPAVLAPGRNRIVVLAWEGVGGFAFRLGFLREDGSRITQSDPELIFHGAGPGASSGARSQPFLTRDYGTAAFLCPDTVHDVTLRRGASSPAFRIDRQYDVVEDLRTDAVSLQIEAMNPGGNLTSIPFANGWRLFWNGVSGSVLNTQGVSYRIRGHSAGVLQASGHASTPSDPGANFPGSGVATSGPRQLAFQPQLFGPLGDFPQAHDIGPGGPCFASNTPQLDGSKYTLYSTATGVAQGGDQITFAYTELTGDFAVQVRFFDNFNPWGEYGLMARWDCRPESPFFFVQNGGAKTGDFTCGVEGPKSTARAVANAAQPITEIAFLRWQEVFQGEPYRCGPADPNPYLQRTGDERNLAPWLRLVRRGSTFFGYASRDGAAWRTLGSFTWFEAPRRMLWGVAAASSSQCNQNAVCFDSFTIEPVAPLPQEAGDDPPLELLGSFAFDDAADNLRCPAGWICNAATLAPAGGGPSASTPRVVSRRLRMLAGTEFDTATSAFWDELLDVDQAYVFEFDAYFTSSIAGPAPADGLTFCLLGVDPDVGHHLDLRQPDPDDPGLGGGGLGYHRFNMLRNETVASSASVSRNSLAVELDVWHNGPEYNDGDGTSTRPRPDGAAGTTWSYHVGVDANASVSSAQRNLQLPPSTPRQEIHDDDLPDIFHPAGVHVTVLYDAGNVKVWLDSNAGGGGGGEQSGKLVADKDIDPLAFNSGKAMAGFTASSGGMRLRAEVDNVLLQVVDNGDYFFRADADGNRRVDIADVLFSLGTLFTGTQPFPCEAGADANADQSVDIADCVHTLLYLYRGAGPLLPPGAPATPDACPTYYKYGTAERLRCYAEVSLLGCQ